MALSELDLNWYIDQINKYAKSGNLAIAIEDNKQIVYPSDLKSDEALVKSFEPEEMVHAAAINLLCNSQYGYEIINLYHEQHFAHGSTGSLSDEVDLLVYDEDGLPYAVMEFKSSECFNREEEKAIKYQLFGTAPLVGSSPKLLVYATIHPSGDDCELTLKCIDYVRYKSYDSWEQAGKPYSTKFPKDYRDLNYLPFVNGGDRDLKVNATLADFRAVATSFHNEFFGEHPDNALFVNLVKCLLAKIYDERTTKGGEEYRFQVKYRNGKPVGASEVFNEVNDLYKESYSRYIDQTSEPDEIDPKEFSPEKVKSVVKALESLSITKGAALHGDIIGTFFEEILRSGFKQDKGMYFTHTNLIRFMIEALDLTGLTKSIWKKATHPENRLPYIIDPACGSGAFLLHAMNQVTSTIRDNKEELVSDFEETQFYNARLSDNNPNYWAENFIYGFDPKFIMAITSKVNMVLHGDGSAHMFKYDAFKPFTSYNDTKLRSAGESERSISKASYDKDLAETFDVVLSNPPFGITLSRETKKGISKTFTLPDSTPSDALFIERAFQLLKPGGRLAVVLPESIFNAVDGMTTRLFIYRMFNVRAIVALPRNVFIDTPTLTSLLFAQKKTPLEIRSWDSEWEKHLTKAKSAKKQALDLLRKKDSSEFENPHDLRDAVIEKISGIVNSKDWIFKRGKNSEVLKILPEYSFETIDSVIEHYKNILKSSGMDKFITRFAFTETVNNLDCEFNSYIVDEVGYKLSKRKEKPRPNQLMKLRGLSGEMVTNIHLCESEYKIVVDLNDPSTVLDYIKRDVRWA